MFRYFRFPFAENGDRQSVPDESATTEVNYEAGYTPEYELPKSDPDRRNVDRQPFNGVIYDITANLKFWQENNAPEIVADDGTGSPVSYPLGFVGVSGGAAYQSIVEGTTTVPPSAEWIEYSGSYYFRPLSGGGSLAANKQYFVTDSLTYTLPDVSGINVGDSVILTKSAAESPTVNTFGAENISVRAGVSVGSIQIDQAQQSTLVWDGSAWQLGATSENDNTFSGVNIFSQPVTVPDATGNDKAAALGQLIGHNQAWQDVTASRSSGIVYTNSTGRTIFVAVTTESAGAGGTFSLNIEVDGNTIIAGPSDYSQHAVFPVPPGSTYEATTANIDRWWELR